MTDSEVGVGGVLGYSIENEAYSEKGEEDQNGTNRKQMAR